MRSPRVAINLPRFMKVLITGSTGLIGSETVVFCDHGGNAHGIDDDIPERLCQSPVLK